MSLMLRWVDIDEQAMKEAILNPHASPRRGSRGETPGAESEYAGVVAELRQLRAASQLSRYRGAAPRLPSREAISEIVESLVSALYPRHFGPPGLDARDADRFVARTLATALPALRQQIELALALEQEDARDAAGAKPRSAAEITRSFAAALPKIRAALDKDVRAAFANDPSAKSIDEVSSAFRASPRSYATASRMSFTGSARLCWRGSSPRSRMRRPASTSTPAPRSARVSSSTTAPASSSARPRDRQQRAASIRAVTLGAKRFEMGGKGELRKSYPRHPIVEDDVVIYAGATILGRITIGRGSSIGGNVWLTESVPPGSGITQAKTQANGDSHPI